MEPEGTAPRVRTWLRIWPFVPYAPLAMALFDRSGLAFELALGTVPLVAGWWVIGVIAATTKPLDRVALVLNVCGLLLAVPLYIYVVTAEPTRFHI